VTVNKTALITAMNPGAQKTQRTIKQYDLYDLYKDVIRVTLHATTAIALRLKKFVMDIEIVRMVLTKYLQYVVQYGENTCDLLYALKV